MGNRAFSGRNERRFINWEREGLLGKGSPMRKGSGCESAWSVQHMGSGTFTSEWSLGESWRYNWKGQWTHMAKSQECC